MCELSLNGQFILPSRASLIPEVRPRRKSNDSVRKVFPDAEREIDFVGRQRRVVVQRQNGGRRQERVRLKPEKHVFE